MVSGGGSGSGSASGSDSGSGGVKKFLVKLEGRVRC